MIRHLVLSVMLLVGCGGEDGTATTGSAVVGATATAAASAVAETVVPDATRRPATVEAAQAAAEKATGKLMATLMHELSAGLKAGPPAKALHVCADAAQRLTAEVAASEGIAIRRTALRYRNPKNAPDDWERAALESWAAGAGPWKPRAEVTGEGAARELRYLRPIGLKSLCEKCHGDPAGIDPAVTAAIAEHYPEDEATGFEEGDLRGAFSVRVPLPE